MILIRITFIITQHPVRERINIHFGIKEVIEKPAMTLSERPTQNLASIDVSIGDIYVLRALKCMGLLFLI